MLLINLTEQPLILLTCLLIGKDKCTLNSPWLSVFTSARKLGVDDVFLHATATDAPEEYIRLKSEIEGIFIFSPVSSFIPHFLKLNFVLSTFKIQIFSPLTGYNRLVTGLGS